MLSHYKALSLCAAVAAAALGITAVAMPASAKAKQDGFVVTAPRLLPSRAVGYRDLNLATLRDQNVLIRRIDRAVVEVCDELITNLAEADRDHACRAASWQKARPQMARAIAQSTEASASGDVTAVAAVISVSPAG